MWKKVKLTNQTNRKYVDTIYGDKGDGRVSAGHVFIEWTQVTSEFQVNSDLWCANKLTNVN